MKTKSLLFIFIFISHLTVFAQHDGVHNWMDEPDLSAKTNINSWDGWYMEPRGTYRILNIMVNIIYDLTPKPYGSGSYWSQAYNEGINNECIPYSLMSEFCDNSYIQGTNMTGVLSRLYHESSFGELVLIGDFVVVNIKQSTVSSGFLQAVI